MSDQKLVRRLVRTVFSCALAVGLVACSSDDDDGAGSTQIEVQGEWSSNFGGEEQISTEAWNGFEIVAFDNDENTAVTHNAPDAEFNPDTYSKVVWTEVDADTFYYCIAAFGLETLEVALETEGEADDSDPETGGCGAFPWTKLTRVAP